MSSSDFSRHDAMLAEILEARGSLVGFLETIFGFLDRRTDFYYIKTKETDHVGLPPGIKEKIVMQAMQSVGQKSDNPLLVADEVEIEADTKEAGSLGSITSTLEQTTVSQADPPKHAKNVPPKQPDSFQTNEYKNGAVYSTYCWSQTSHEVEIHIRLPEHIKSAKQIALKISSDAIQVQEKGTQPPSSLFEGKLCRKCKSNEAVWSISDGKLQISIDKVTQAWWDRLLTTEPSIDMNKLDVSKDMNEMPDDLRYEMDRIAFDHQQRMQGKPTSKDIEGMSKLRKGWDTEGSPFKGQPLDPSLIKFE